MGFRLISFLSISSALTFLQLMFCFAGFAQGQLNAFPVSPFNQHQVSEGDSSQKLRFLVGGHFYGSHENKLSIFPAASLLANIPKINQSGAMMLVSCGDMMRDGKDSLFHSALKQSLSGMEIPVLNAPGNHDLFDRKAYLKSFHSTQSAFILHQNLFLLLDTELWIEGKSAEVVQFIAQQNQALKASGLSVQNVFVFSHRLVWSCLGPPMDEVDAVCNEPILHRADAAQGKAIVDAVKELAGKTSVFWFSGDVGAKWSVPLLVMDGPENMHFFATGIGDAADDALLKVDVDENGKVKVELFPLSPQPLPALESHDIVWAKKEKASKENQQAGMPWWKRKVLWAGLAVGVLLGFGLAYLILSRRKTVV